jgi:MFS family permease
VADITRIETDPAPLKRRHVAAATIGNALEFYDFLTYTFFSIQIGHAFFPAQTAYGSLMLSLATFGAGFITRPVGAFVIGAYADRAGRRPAMMLCFVLIGCAIVGMALIPPYASIGVAAPILAIAARMVQGFSLGGDIGANTAYLVEAASARNRGLIISWQAASQYMALIAGGVVGTVLTSVLTPAQVGAYGWRIAFLIGGVAIPFGLWLRTSLPETLEPKPAHRGPGPGLAPGPESRTAVARAHWQIIALGLVVQGTATVAAYINSYTITYAQDTLHMPTRIGFIANLAANIVAIPTVLLGGWMADRFGRRPLNIWSNVALLLIVVPVFSWVVTARTAVALVGGMVALVIASNLGTAALYACTAETLPQSIRGVGFGLVYSIAVAIVGGTTQLVVTWLIHVTGSAMAPAWYLSAATAIGLVGYLLIRESAPGRVAAAQ